MTIPAIHCCDAWVAAGGKGTPCGYCGMIAIGRGRCVHLRVLSAMEMAHDAANDASEWDESYEHGFLFPESEKVM